MQLHSLELRLFGAWTWRVGETTSPRLRSRQGQWLLALLALHHGTPIERAWLASRLWPESDDTQARYNLRRNLTDLRQALAGDAWRLLSPTPRSLTLDLTDADCDLVEFDAALAEDGQTGLERAVALYHGPLLSGCLEDWVVPEREAREQAVMAALETLAQNASQPQEAISHLQHALTLDPLRENSVRGLMRALTAQNRHAAATDAYHAFRRRLRDTLNADPAPETVALSQQIRAQGRGLAALPEQSHTPEGFETSPQPNRHLPLPLTPLIGRRQEIEEVTACLSLARLLTLTGTGGVGKTRLALAVAEALCGGASPPAEFADGAWFVDLAPLSDPELVATATLASLGVREEPGRAPVETLTDVLRPKRLLLILDNCEQVASACAHLALALLQRCPTLRILATSRETLRVTGELVWRVPSLGLPERGGDSAKESDSVRLFLDRASQANPALVPSPSDRAEIAQICRRLDGIPLSLEMAAARTRSLTPSQIAARLDDRFRLLIGPAGESLPRNQTLKATLDWSYDLLDQNERTLFARLSVFAGGWTLEAAEYVCADAGDGQADVLDLLSSLVDKSLTLYETWDGGRYRLLETVRQYAHDRLAERGDTADTHRRHHDFFTALVSSTGPDQAAHFQRLETEHDNLRAALAWSQTANAPDAPLRLAASLSDFWQIRGHLSQGRAALGAALQAAPVDPPTPTRLQALLADGHLAACQGDYADAVRLFTQAREAAQKLGRSGDETAALGSLGGVLSSQGNYAAAQPLLEQALAQHRTQGRVAGQTGLLGSLGYIAREQGNYAAARDFLTQAVALSRALGDTQEEGSHSGSLAYVVLHQGDLTEARRLLDHTRTLYATLGNRGGEAWALSSLSHLEAEQEEFQAARALLEEALGINRAVGNRGGEAWNLSALGEIEVGEGRFREGQATLQQALALSREIGSLTNEGWAWKHLGDAALGLNDAAEAHTGYTSALASMHRAGVLHGTLEVLERFARLSLFQKDAPHAVTLLACVEQNRPSLGPPPSPARRARQEHMLAQARAALDPEAFEVAWRRGREMSLEQAVVIALGGST